MAVIEDVRQGLLLPSTSATQGGWHWPVAAGLHSAHRQEIQPCLVDEPILVKREECTSIGKKGVVWVEGEGIEGPALVTGAFDGIQVACPNDVLHHLKGPLPLMPGEMVIGGVQDGRLRRDLNGGSSHHQAGSSRAPQAMQSSTGYGDLQHVPPQGGSGVQKLRQIFMLGGVQSPGPLGDSLSQLLQSNPMDYWISGVPQELEGLGCPSDMGLVLHTGDTQAPKGLR